MLMRIQTLREAQAMTQIQLAAQMGVNQNTVSQWENEVALPRTRDLPLLARVLRCTIDDLYAPEDTDDAAGEPAC